MSLARYTCNIELMIALGSAIGIYLAVFGIDYLFYRYKGAAYEYVSRRTYILFTLGSILLLTLFWAYFKAFFIEIMIEIVPITLIFVVMVLFSTILTRERLLVCHYSSRTERCLTPAYVLIKGADILFQQLTYALIALSLVSILGYHPYTYILFILILLTIHTPLVLHAPPASQKLLTFGMALLTVPILYFFVRMQLFWPAIYLHSLLYIFLWLSFANWEVEPVTRVTDQTS